MGIRGFAEYLGMKYAGYDDFSSNPPDTSFGKPISPEKTRILKDKLILTYDKVTSGVTQLPFYQILNKELANEFYWKVFQDLITNLAASIEYLPLKDAFSFSVKLIDSLNQLRNAIVKGGMEREKLLKMDEGIKNIQDYIWKESKRVLNLHDLKGLIIEAPELQGIVNTLVPTWDYGPGKNPSKGLLYKKPKTERAGGMMKRLLQEIEDEKKGK